MWYCGLLWIYENDSLAFPQKPFFSVGVSQQLVRPRPGFRNSLAKVNIHIMGEARFLEHQLSVEWGG